MAFHSPLWSLRVISRKNTLQQKSVTPARKSKLVWHVFGISALSRIKRLGVIKTEIAWRNSSLAVASENVPPRPKFNL